MTPTKLCKIAVGDLNAGFWKRLGREIDCQHLWDYLLVTEEALDLLRGMPGWLSRPGNTPALSVVEPVAGVPVADLIAVREGRLILCQNEEIPEFFGVSGETIPGGKLPGGLQAEIFRVGLEGDWGLYADNLDVWKLVDLTSSNVGRDRRA